MRNRAFSSGDFPELAVVWEMPPLDATPLSATAVCHRMHGIWIGTSGWVYKHWAANFYPKGWPMKKEFGYYVRHFPTVEINATFYRLPTLKMVRGWHDKAPAGFVFAIKGSRFLTHLKRLKDTGAGLKKYFSRLAPLADRTGPILWQLPPNFLKNEETMMRLERFLQKLPRRYQHAVEFRHPSWMDEETFSLLRKHRAANVWLSSLRMPADDTLTADFAYLRFHGLKDGAYHDYARDELEPWARALAKVARKELPAYVYFNNDLNTRAPLNAAMLMEMVGKSAVTAFVSEADGSATELPRIKPPPKGPETWPSWTRRSKKTKSSAARRRKQPAANTRRRRRSSPLAPAAMRRFVASPTSPAVRPSTSAPPQAR